MLQPSGEHAGQGWSLRSNGVKFPLRLAGQLQGSTLEAVEHARDGKDLNIRIELHGTLLIKDGVQSGYANISHSIDHGAWSKILQALEWSRGVHIDVRLPDPNRAADFARAVEHLDGAVTSRLRGEWAEAVGRCRLSLEALKTT